ncbi:MAG: hypothetical protein QE278_03840 [Limnobacter sp.]|nr:hypothetical protein [Limnobacter sp.]
MVVFPLQAVLAAVEAYHGHGKGHGLDHESTIELVLHSHAEHDHNTHHDTGSACEGDHHHCHAHSVTVLSSLTNFVVPMGSLAQMPARSKGYQSFLSNRIERPKWA